MKTRKVVIRIEVPFLESWDKRGTDPVESWLIPAIDANTKSWHGEMTVLGSWDEVDNDSDV